MSHDLIQKRFSMAAADTPNVDSAGAVAEFVFPGPVIITKVGLLVTTAIVTDNSVAMSATLSRRPIVGSTAGAVSLGVFNMIAAGVDPAAGAVIWAPTNIPDLDGEQPEDYSAVQGRASRNEAPNSNIVVIEVGANPWAIYPGQSFAMTLDTNAEGDSGAGRAWVEYIELPFNATFIDQANVTQKTVTAAA